MFNNYTPDSPPIPPPVTPQELDQRQAHVAKLIPLVMDGQQVTIDETAIEAVSGLYAPYAAAPLPPNQFRELKNKLKAQFNAVAKPLPFDGRELENETANPVRTVVMASPEKLADDHTLESKVQIFESWFSVRHALLNAGAHIEIIPPTLQEGGFREVYTRDRYVIVGDTAYLPDPDFITPQNFPDMSQDDMVNYKGEIVQIEKTLQQLGVNTVVVKDAWFEGGNVIRHYSSNTLFLGLDGRTYEEDAEKLIEAVNATQPEQWQILPVPLTNMSLMYHLDLGMSEELPHGEVMFSAPVTDAETFEKIRAIVGSRNIIPLSYNEAQKFATNMIDIGDTLVMTGNCPALRADLIDRGYQVIMPADYGRETFEFGLGGVHCMTNDVRQVHTKSVAATPSI